MTDCIFCKTNECPFCKARSANSDAAYNSELHSMIDPGLARSSYNISGAGEYKIEARGYSEISDAAGKYNAPKEIYTHSNSQSNLGDYSGGED